jgi:hypothetical protein
MRYTNELWGSDKENQKEKTGYVVVLFTIFHIPDSGCSVTPMNDDIIKETVG